MRLTFEGFEVDLDACQLILAGNPVALERRAFEMLAYLAAHPNRLVSKDELLSEVWHARALSEGAVMNAATKLRKAFGQAAGTSAPIETLRGRGYRLHAMALTGDAPKPATDSDPFVGRAQVLASLEHALERGRTGQGQLVLLTGDAGIGKTRTLDELAKRARAHGFSVWEGTAYDGGAAPAYWPWIEILRAAHADLSRSMFRQHIAGGTAALARLVPELLDAQPSAAEHAQADATRFQLFDELTRFLSSASAAAPRLLIVDDAHWADAGTLELCAFAARALKKRSVVLLVALREHSFAAADARAQLLARLGRQATHVPMSGLAPGEVEQLVAALAPTLGVDLYERSQGNPFFVRQLIELLAQAGTPSPAAIPQAVRELLQQRIAALDPATQAVLRVAAAIGSELDVGVLVSALGQSAAEVLGALDPALRRAVIVRVANTEQRFAFGHVLQRDAIYEGLDLPERGELHARLARVLEQRAAGADVRALGELARHHLLAVPCDLEACVRHCARAAAAARDALGFEAAAELLARACDKLASEAGDQRARCELLLVLGQDHFCTGNVRQAWQALQQGAAIADHLHAPELLARFACRLASWLELGGGDEEEVRAWVDRALQLVGDSDPDLQAALIAHRTEMHFELPAAERLRLLDQAAALATQPLIKLEIALCRAGLRDPTQLEEAARALAAYRALALEHRRELDAPQRLLHDFAAELGEYVRALSTCELQAADAVIERCRGIAEHSQVAAVALGVELMQAGRALGDGRLDDLAAAVEHLREGSSLAGGFSLVWASYALRLLEAQNGLTDLAGLATDPPPGLEELRPAQQMNGRLWLARLNAKLGAHDKARRMLASIPSEQLERMPVRYGDLGLLCFLAEIYCELSDTAGASALYAKLLPFAERNAVGLAFDYSGAVAHYLGMLARLLQRTEQAALHFELAERINRGLGMPLQAALSAQLRAALSAEA